MMPEEKARREIDRQLEQCGWLLQDRREMNISAGLGVAIREFSVRGGEADYLLYVAGKALGVIEAKVLSIRLLLPPVAEQGRIVQKIEELFSKLDAGVKALERVQIALKRYRAAVLKVAIEGKLTAEWRAKHPDSEPASELLQRILSERRRKWEQELPAKYKEPVGPETSGLPQLPEGWCRASIDQLLIAPLCNGISVKGTDAPPGVPALRLSAMSTSGFDYGDRRYIRIDDETARSLAVREGDFFVSRGNGSLHLLGRGTLAQAPDEGIVFPDTMIRLRLAPLASLIRLVALMWESRPVRGQIEGKARTTAGIYKISQADLRALVVPFPPLAEQGEIIAEVERRLPTVDALEAQVEANLQRAARLRQGILKRAFEGRLVPQDPRDEPAERLLEQVRASRSTRSTRNGNDQEPEQNRSSAGRG